MKRMPKWDRHPLDIGDYEFRDRKEQNVKSIMSRNDLITKISDDRKWLFIFIPIICYQYYPEIACRRFSWPDIISFGNDDDPGSRSQLIGSQTLCVTKGRGGGGFIPNRRIDTRTTYPETRNWEFFFSSMEKYNWIIDKTFKTCPIMLIVTYSVSS